MRIARLLVCLIALLLVAAPAAGAATSVGLPTTKPHSVTVPPPGFAISANQAEAIARSLPAVKKVLRDNPNPVVDVSIFDGSFWQVQIARHDDELAMVDVDISPAGAVSGVYSGLSAYNYTARGKYDRTLRKPWVWLPFALLFVLPFV